MSKITKGQLAHRFAYIAKELGHDGEEWTRQADGTLKANLGVWVLRHNTYYGWSIEENVTDGGGVTSITLGLSASEMWAFLSGMGEAIKQMKKQTTA